MAKTLKNAKKTVNKGIDTIGKKAGLNVLERRKLKKGVSNFCYDTGVNAASTLIVDGVETGCYLLGKGTAKLVITAASAGKTLAKGTVSVAKSAANAAKDTATKVSEKASKKSSKKETEEDESSLEEQEEVLEEEDDEDAE